MAWTSEHEGPEFGPAGQLGLDQGGFGRVELAQGVGRQAGVVVGFGGFGHASASSSVGPQARAWVGLGSASLARIALRPTWIR